MCVCVHDVRLCVAECLLAYLSYIIIRKYDSTLCVGMVQGVSNSQYIGIGTKSRKAPKSPKTKLGRVKYQLFLN